MDEIFEQMRKDFDDFLEKEEKFIRNYKKGESVKKDIGKLCWFWDYGSSEFKHIGILHNIEDGMYRDYRNVGYDCYRRLTPQEVSEITGYEVVDLG